MGKLLVEKENDENYEMETRSTPLKKSHVRLSNKIGSDSIRRFG